MVLLGFFCPWMIDFLQTSSLFKMQSFKLFLKWWFTPWYDELTLLWYVWFSPPPSIVNIPRTDLQFPLGPSLSPRDLQLYVNVATICDVSGFEGPNLLKADHSNTFLKVQDMWFHSNIICLVTENKRISAQLTSYSRFITLR